MAAAGVLLLLLLAWHFSIQASAHHTAREQVNAWLKSMGGQAEDVQFRMLRGALTVKNIKTSYQGSPVVIQRLFLKGNPASISTEKPLLHQVIVQQVTLDAQPLTQQWQNLDSDIPLSLRNIFTHAKHITFEDVSIQHVGKLEEINLKTITLSGADEQRTLVGQGFIGEQGDNITFHGLFPTDASTQAGEIVSDYQGTHSRMSWSGSWQTSNFQATVDQSHNQDDATLLLKLKQAKTQWKGDFQANHWPIETTTLKTKLTGQGQIEGTPNKWSLKSQEIFMDNNTWSNPELNIEHVLASNIQLDSSTKNANIESLAINNGHITLDTNLAQNMHSDWKWDIKNIDVHNLEPELVIQQNSVLFPALNGIAKVSPTSFELDLSSQTGGERFWRIQSSDGDAFQLDASAIPLLQLRNLLPEPMQKNALTLEGLASLKFTIQPFDQWRSSGEAVVSDMVIASKNQTFKTKQLVLTVEHANVAGVQKASLVANQWLMQFPLTPRQAWTDKSHLDVWTQIAWPFERIQLNRGQVAIGNANQTWLQNVSLDMHHWQQAKPSILKLQGTFGLAPFQADITLKTTPEQVMQWKTIQLNFKHAQLFALSDWLDISGIPRVEQGHLSLQLKANRDEQRIHGNTHITLDHFRSFTKQHPNDYFLEYTGQHAQSISKQLTRNGAIQLDATFSDDTNLDWSSIAASSLMENIKKRLPQTQTRNAASAKTIKNLGSLAIHHGQGLSQNERTRLRKIIFAAKHKRGWHIELMPDLGTAPLTTELEGQVSHTQTLIRSFMSKRGISARNVFHIFPQEKHKSTSSAGAIHINLVK